MCMTELSKHGIEKQEFSLCSYGGSADFRVKDPFSSNAINNIAPELEKIFQETNEDNEFVIFENLLTDEVKVKIQYENVGDGLSLERSAAQLSDN